MDYFTCTPAIVDNYLYKAWGGIFPIVKLRCTRPPRLQLEEHTNDSQRVSWTGDSDCDYQLAIATYGNAPGTGTILLVPSTEREYTFDNLQVDSIYQVWVRRSCQYTTGGYDTLVFSEWSRPVTFRTAVSHTEGIGEVDDPALQVSVREGCIVVQDLAAGQRAEVYDMLGRRVAGLAADGRTAPLPQGVYMVRTGQSRARKVVVLR